jgi:hypothetical protein
MPASTARLFRHSATAAHRISSDRHVFCPCPIAWMNGIDTIVSSGTSAHVFQSTGCCAAAEQGGALVGDRADAQVGLGRAASSRLRMRARIVIAPAKHATLKPVHTSHAVW